MNTRRVPFTERTLTPSAIYDPLDPERSALILAGPSTFNTLISRRRNGVRGSEHTAADRLRSVAVPGSESAGCR